MICTLVWFGAGTAITAARQPDTAPAVAAPAQAAPVDDASGDGPIDSLLRQAEAQIAAGHTIAPPDDNALQTWGKLLARAEAAPYSPATITALHDFVIRVRKRAEDDRAGGRMQTAIDLSVFADLASQLLASADAPPPAAPRQADARSVLAGPAAPPPAAPPPAAVSPAAPSMLPLQAYASDAAPPPALALNPDPPQAAAPNPVPTLAASPRSAGPVLANKPADPPAAPASGAEARAGASPPPAASPAVAAPAPAPASMAQEADAAGLYLRRGDDLIAIKDVSGARKLYAFAARAGNARAAAALARTYDGAFLARLGVVGIRGDPEQAELWNRRAAALSEHGAQARLTPAGEKPGE